MSAVIGALRADLGANIAQFQSDLGKAADTLKGFSKVAKQVGRECEEIGKQMSIAFTLPLTILGTEAVKRATQAAQAMAGLKAAITSTGNASGRTAEQLEESSKQLRNISNFEGEDILRGVTTNLLRFGNVQGETFDRAQQAIVNLSAALGGDLQANTIKVGRALNDPIAGVLALTRLGVQFTEQQKEQIKALVQSGNGMKAQALILDTLEQKYGGAAKALRDATPGAALKNAWEDFTETIGQSLIPILTDLMNVLIPIMQTFSAMPGWLRDSIIAFAAFTAVIGPLLTSFGFLLRLFGMLAPLMVPVIAAFASLDFVALGLVVALAAVVAAVVIFGDAINDVFSGNFHKAVTDAKIASGKIAGFFSKAFSSVAGAPDKGAPPPGYTPPKPSNFNLGPDQVAARKELGHNIDSMNAKIAKSLGGLVDDKATADANALNAEIDAFVKKAEEAGVSTKAFADRISGLRGQIELLKQQGLAKEAQDFSEKVSADQLSVDKFAKGSLPALQEKLADVDDQYKALHEKISDQITQNAVLADSNADAAAAMERLKTMLGALEIAHAKATLAAQNQYAAEQGLAHLQSFGAQDATRYQIEDLRQASGREAPLTSGQDALQQATRQLQDELVASETKLGELVKERFAIEETGSDQQKSDLDAEIALQRQLGDLVAGTTADQLVKTKALNDAFREFTDTVSQDLTDMLVNWNGNLSDLGKAFKQMLAQAFLKPVVDDLVGALGGLLKGSGGGAAGGALSGVGGFLKSTFGGLFADGGTLNPGEWGIAGERGPEPIFGGTSGLSVVPAQSGGGRGSIYVDARGATEGVAAQIQSALQAVIPGAIKTAVKQAGQNVPTQMQQANKRQF